jgi:hypothetical protein
MLKAQLSERIAFIAPRITTTLTTRTRFSVSGSHHADPAFGWLLAIDTATAKAVIGPDAGHTVFYTPEVVTAARAGWDFHSFSKRSSPRQPKVTAGLKLRGGQSHSSSHVAIVAYANGRNRSRARESQPTMDVPRFSLVLAWPNEIGLTPIIGDLQQLNPKMGLQAATDEEGGDILIASKAPPLDSFVLFMPMLVDDEMLSSFSKANREWSRLIDEAELDSAQRRIERSAKGNLVVRPRSRNVDSLIHRLRMGYRTKDHDSLEEMSRLWESWRIYRDGSQTWEVDYAYLPSGHFDCINGTPESNQEWLRMTPTGTISFIDANDLPIEWHHRRAMEIVASGSAFAVVVDIVAEEMRVFRPDGHRVTSGSAVIPELPWFEIPVPTKSTKVVEMASAIVRRATFS